MAIDFNSAAWKETTKWAETEQNQTRLRNDAVGLSEAETNANRGEIRFIKKLLSLPQKTATMASVVAPE